MLLAVPLIERTARLNPLSADRDAIYATLGRMLIMLGRDATDVLMGAAYGTAGERCMAVSVSHERPRQRRAGKYANGQDVARRDLNPFARISSGPGMVITTAECCVASC